jgi:hypothetical protein
MFTRGHRIGQLGAQPQETDLGDRIAASHHNGSLTYAELKRQVDHV